MRVAVTRPEASWATVVSSGSEPISGEQLFQPAGLALVRNIRLFTHLSDQLGQSRGQGHVLFTQSGARRAYRVVCMPPAAQPVRQRPVMALASRTGVCGTRRCKTRGRSAAAAVGHGNEQGKIERVMGSRRRSPPNSLRRLPRALQQRSRHGVTGSAVVSRQGSSRSRIQPAVSPTALQRMDSLQPPGEAW